VKKNDMRKQKGIIKKFLEEEIVSRYYFQKGRIEFSLNSDPEVLQAIALVNDKSKYKAVLSLIEKPNKPFNLNKKF
jgi:carboxyl-terminal processing protease